MAKICFPNPVKYNGVNHNAYEVFEVKASDVPELKKKGGWSVEEAEKTETAEKATKKTASKKKAEVTEE